MKKDRIYTWRAIENFDAIGNIWSGFKIPGTNYRIFVCTCKELINSLNKIEDYTGEFRALYNNAMTYLLVGIGKNKNKIYVGESRGSTDIHGLKRIKNHIGNDCGDSYKDEWDIVIVITTSDNTLSKASVLYIENFLTSYFLDSNKVLTEDKQIKLLNDPSKCNDGNLQNPEELTPQLKATLELLSEKRFNIPFLNDVYNDTLTSMLMTYKMSQMAKIDKELRTKQNDDAEKLYRAYLMYDNLMSSAKDLTINGCIYNTIGKDEIVTPVKYARKINESIRDKLLNQSSLILNIYCKDGVFITDGIDLIMENAYKDKNKSTEELRKLLDDSIVRFFAICSNHNSCSTTYYKLDKCIKKHMNIIYKGNIPLTRQNYILPVVKLMPEISYLVKSYQHKDTLRRIISRKLLTNVVHDKLNTEEIDNMKFNVVIGNPPFQEDVGRTENVRNTRPIYDKFIKAGIDLLDDDGYLAMITNNTLLSNDAKADIRDMMIENGLKILVNYPKSAEVFNNVGVSACHFLVDKKNKDHEFRYEQYEDDQLTSAYETVLHKGDSIYKFKEINLIKNKLKAYKNMDSYSLGNKAYNIANDFKVGFSGKNRSTLQTFDNPDKGLVKVLYGTSKNLGYKYVRRCDVPKDIEYIDEYKVVVKEVQNKASLNGFNNSIILEPGCINAGGWSVCAHSKDKAVIENVQKYMCTDIFKICVFLYASEGMTHMNNQMYSHIPALDFTAGGSIDWSLSIDDLNNKLYSLFGVSKDEIEVIKKILD